MSSKRKHSDISAAGPTESGAGHDDEYSHHGSKSKKHKKSTEKSNPASINWVKKRVRAIERRLAMRDGLSANAQRELEKELEYHKARITDLADHRKRRDMIKKYHMVRFFERKKATRLAKQIRSQLQTATDKEERRRLEADLHIAEVDALYAQYFPYRERYVSLYPVAQKESKDKADASAAAKKALRSERPPMWKTIEEAAEKGESALKQIVERRLPETSGRSRTQEPQSTKRSSTTERGQARSKGSSAPDSRGPRESTGRQQKQTGSKDADDDDDDDDGGFFEEA
ncbi:hypothetical protein F5Y17DRAFT_454650 [Xylariaceae sp. FL0594]|nr:hypothetical protein F5Y17DRAFT_454650 [Xylariaceae sp. FL0594]